MSIKTLLMNSIKMASKMKNNPKKLCIKSWQRGS